MGTVSAEAGHQGYGPPRVELRTPLPVRQSKRPKHVRPIAAAFLEVGEEEVSQIHIDRATGESEQKSNGHPRGWPSSLRTIRADAARVYA